MTLKRYSKNNQAGFISFLVVAIIMIVLSLIVLAFARLVRREQRQTLDRQLNTQAFYAAESGINDAVNKLFLNPGLANQDYTSCDDFINAVPALNSRLDGPAGVVSYSCLLVDPSPPFLEYDSVPIDQSVTLPLSPSNSSPPLNPPITSLEISWEEAAPGPTTNLAGCPTGGADPNDALPGDWVNCDIGMLRIEIIPFDGAKTRDALITERLIAYLQPRNTGGAAAINFGDAASHVAGGNAGQGETVGALCDGSGPRRCTLRINNVPPMTNGFMRMRSIYAVNAVTITAFSGGGPVGLAGVQAAIDSTGKANDVLKRIKVTVPLADGDEPFPEFALQSTGSLCKRITVSPGSPPTYSVLSPGTTSPNDECNPHQTQNKTSP